MSLHQFGAYTDQFGIGPGCFMGSPGLHHMCFDGLSSLRFAQDTVEPPQLVCTSKQRGRNIWSSQRRFFAEFILERSEGLRMTPINSFVTKYYVYGEELKIKPHQPPGNTHT